MSSQFPGEGRTECVASYYRMYSRGDGVQSPSKKIYVEIRERIPLKGGRPDRHGQQENAIGEAAEGVN